MVEVEHELNLGWVGFQEGILNKGTVLSTVGIWKYGKECVIHRK